MPTCAPIAALIFLVTSLSLGFSTALADATKRSPTVRDSIEWAHLRRFTDPAADESAGGLALYSPDGLHFVLHVRRGDVESNTNVDALLLYRARDVEKYAKSNAKSAPPPLTLLSVPIRKDEESISGVRWLSDTQLGLVSKAPNGHMQSFTVDIVNRTVKQLTSSDTDVIAFSQAGQTTLYFACVPQVVERTVSVVVQTFAEAMPPTGNGGESPCYVTTPYEMYASTAERPNGERLALPAMRMGPSAGLRQIWAAPSGDQAIVLMPAVNAPSHWAAYTGPLHDRWGFGPEWVRSDATSFDLINRYRYVIVDLRKRQFRSLLDAPNGTNAFNQTPPAVFWRADESSVIVSNTFLPLEGIAAGERERRERQPAIAEVNLRSGQVTPIEWEDVPPNIQTRLESPIIGFEWQAAEDRLTVMRRNADPRVSRRVFLRRGGAWSRGAAEKGCGQCAAYSLRELQSLNERPKLYVQPGGGRQKKLLFDPNPQAEQLNLGTAKVTRWKDNNGTQWTGGVLMPSRLTPGARYPLIVQTHGFDPDKFLLDGPLYDGQGATAFAAQALVGAGFVVLQVEDNPPTITLDEREGPLVAEGFRSGIEHMIASGNIDPARVGLVAFSRTGHHALHLLSRYPQLVAAATMSDSLLVGYAAYLFNMEGSAEADLAKLTGGSPTSENVSAWFSGNPLYDLSKSTAAIRLESIGSGLGMWEAYAVMRTSRRRTEMLVYPDGNHVLEKPAERLISQGGTVDWFRFWLQSYEDPGSEKEDQYRRWRKLRDNP